MMEPGLAELSQTLQKKLDSLQNSLKDSDNKSQVASQFSASLAGSTKVASEGVIIELGDGMWVQKTQQEAIDFYERKFNRQLSENNRIKANIQEINATLEGIRSLGNIFQTQGETAEIQEDLPIVDIQENLDDDGNVTEVKLNDKTFSAKPGSNNKLSSRNVKHNGEDENRNSEQIRELLEDMELWEPEQDSMTQPGAIGLVNGSQEANATVKCRADEELLPTKMEKNIDPSNLLELELIANDIELEEDSREESNELDYSYQDSEGDVSDSGSDFNEQYSLLPSSSMHHDRLWKEVQELRNKKTQENSQIVEKKVRFKEALEINEVENVGEILRNVEHEKQSVSRFKENLILNGRSALNSSSNGHSSKEESQTDLLASRQDEEVTTDIIEKPLNAELAVSFSNSNAIEKTHTEPKDKNPKRSRFKTSRVIEANGTKSTKLHRASSTANNEHLQDSKVQSLSSSFEDAPSNDTDEFVKLEKEVARDRKRKVTSKFKKMIYQNPDQNPQGKNLSSISTAISERSNSDVEVPDNKCLQEVINDPEWSQEGTQGLISAYNSGFFDDDMEVNGPVVNELEDFEKLNLIIESMSKPESNLQSHATERDSTEDLDQMSSCSDSVHSNSDDESVMNEIIENEYNPSNYGLEEDDFTIEQDITQREIENNYYRLRQKIFADFGNNIETENDS